MKKIIIYISLFLGTIIGTSIYQFKTVTHGIDDCMLEYIKEGGDNAYLYSIKSGGFHIDKRYIDNEDFIEIGKSENCFIKVDSLKYSFLAISNSIYCSVSKILLSNQIKNV